VQVGCRVTKDRSSSTTGADNGADTGADTGAGVTGRGDSGRADIGSRARIASNSAAAISVSEEFANRVASIAPATPRRRDASATISPALIESRFRSSNSRDSTVTEERGYPVRWLARSNN